MKRRDALKLGFIILIALAARIAYMAIVLIFAGEAGLRVTDSRRYTELANALFEGRGFVDVRGSLETFRVPGYPLFLALFMKLAGSGWAHAVCSAQIIISAAAVGCVYGLSKLVSKDERWATAAALIAALNPLDMRYCSLIMSDSLCQSFTLAAVYLLARWLRALPDGKPRLGALVTAAVLTGCAAFIRPSVMYFPFALALGAGFIALIKHNAKRALAGFLCFALMGAVPIVGWTARNRAYTEYDGYASVAEVNGYIYNAAYVYAKQTGADYESTREAFKDWEDEEFVKLKDEMGLYGAYRKRASDIIRSDIPAYAGGCALGALLTLIYPGANDVLSFTGFDGAERVKALIRGDTEGLGGTLAILALYGANALVLLSLAVAFIIGLSRAKGAEWYIIALIVCSAAYMIAVSCQPVGIGSYARFRVSLSLFVCVFAGGAFVRRDTREKRRVNAAASEKSA